MAVTACARSASLSAVSSGASICGARVRRISAASAFSCSQRACECRRVRRLRARVVRQPVLATRAACSSPPAISRSQDAEFGVDQGDAALAVLDRGRNGGLAHRHARAGGVDQADTALSGNCRDGNVARRQPHRLAHRLVQDADLVVLLQRADQAADHRDGHRLGWVPRPSPPGSAGSGRRPSRSISCIPPRWSRRWCAVRRAPAPASAGWRHRPARPSRRRRSTYAPRR